MTDAYMRDVQQAFRNRPAVKVQGNERYMKLLLVCVRFWIACPSWNTVKCSAKRRLGGLGRGKGGGGESDAWESGLQETAKIEVRLSCAKPSIAAGK